jgi:hypothetical protein
MARVRSMSSLRVGGSSGSAAAEGSGSGTVTTSP